MTAPLGKLLNSHIRVDDKKWGLMGMEKREACCVQDVDLGAFHTQTLLAWGEGMPWCVEIPKNLAASADESRLEIVHNPMVL